MALGCLAPGAPARCARVGGSPSGCPSGLAAGLQRGGPHSPSEPLRRPEQEASVGAERTQGGALATSKTHRGAVLGLGGIRLAPV